MTQDEEDYFISHPSGFILLLVALLMGNLLGFAASAYANEAVRYEKNPSAKERIVSEDNGDTSQNGTSAPMDSSKDKRIINNAEDKRTDVGSGANGSSSGSSK